MPGEDKTPDSATKKVVAKRPSGGPSRKKPRRDVNAPKAPMSGYVRYLVDGRVRLTANPRPELTTTQEALTYLAREWKSLSAEDKLVYTKKAEEDRAAYRKVMEQYKKSDTYKQFQRKIHHKKIDSKKSSTTDEKIEDETYGSDTFPIFSKEFLQHNKERESELRRLRIEIVRLEEEEKALNLNIPRLKVGCDEIENDLAIQKTYNEGLEKHMAIYRDCLLAGFSNCPLPGTSTCPTMDTIDDYMDDLNKLILDASHEHQDFLAKVRDIVRRIKLPSV